MHGENTGPMRYTKPHVERLPPNIDAAALANRYSRDITGEELLSLAGSLGVSESSLWLLGVGRAREYPTAYSFPMYDERMQVVGVRLRSADGSKFAVWGSKQGVFINPADELSGTVAICEGPTDAACVMDWGWKVIGRPSCMGGVMIVKALLMKHQPTVVIVSDTDTPGQTGARKLAGELQGLTVKIVEPAHGKDIRAWRGLGATAGGFQWIVDNTPEYQG